MSNYISSALTGKLARRALKDAFGKKYPNVKFSVRTDNSMNVSWTDGPLASEVDSVVNQFTGATFDGMQDLESSVHSRWSKNHAKWAKGLKDVPVLSVGDDVWFSTKYVFTRRDISREYILMALPVVCHILRNCHEKYDVNPSDYEVVTSDYGSTSVNRIGHGYSSEPRFHGHYIDARSYNVHSMTMNEMVNEYTHARTMADLIPATVRPTVATVTETVETATTETVESVEGVTVRFNDAKQGIEVLFSAKPSESVRAQLKAAKFRWSRNQGLWYAKDTQETRSLAFSFQIPSIESIQNETAEQLNQPATVPAVDSDPGLDILDYEVEQERKRLATAEKLEGLATNMQSGIDYRLRSDRQINTYRRRNIASSMIQDGFRLEGIQKSLRAIAWAMRRDTLAECLSDCTTKKTISSLYDDLKMLQRSSIYSVTIGQQMRVNELSRLIDVYSNRNNNAPDPIALQAQAIADRIKESEIANSGIDGFFPTPDALADEVVKKSDVQPHHAVLDSSAGWGSLLAAAKRAGVTDSNIDAIEISHTLFEILEERGFNVIGRDCLEMTMPPRKYDRILLNPAFENGHAAKEIKHGYLNFLKDGGVLTAIVPSSVMNGDNYLKFREWAVSEANATFERLPDNSFAGIDSARRTGVGTALVILRKGAQSVPQAATMEPKMEPVSEFGEIYQYMIF
jgi:protein-L-isoaspartate O-methyltransferase